MNSICVFCGSTSGANPSYEDAACAMAHALVRAKIHLVYGGGKVGLMGILADAALFEREIAHQGVNDLRVVETMHERKLLMASLSDAFVALPGGVGTLEEIFEQWTWSQLGIHAKPCGFLNVAGYFDPMVAMIEHMVAQGFLQRSFSEMLAIESSPDELLARFRVYRPPARKWSAPSGPAIPV
jgi:uncharacterized protein (TIGR00730 family)